MSYYTSGIQDPGICEIEIHGSCDSQSQDKIKFVLKIIKNVPQIGKASKVKLKLMSKYIMILWNSPKL